MKKKKLFWKNISIKFEPGIVFIKKTKKIKKIIVRAFLFFKNNPKNIKIEYKNSFGTWKIVLGADIPNKDIPCKTLLKDSKKYEIKLNLVKSTLWRSSSNTLIKIGVATINEEIEIITKYLNRILILFFSSLSK